MVEDEARQYIYLTRLIKTTYLIISFRSDAHKGIQKNQVSEKYELSVPLSTNDDKLLGCRFNWNKNALSSGESRLLGDEF